MREDKAPGDRIYETHVIVVILIVLAAKGRIFGSDLRYCSFAKLKYRKVKFSSRKNHFLSACNTICINMLERRAIISSLMTE